MISGTERDSWVRGQERRDIETDGVPHVDDVSTCRYGRVGRAETGGDRDQGRPDQRAIAGRECRHGHCHGTILLMSLVLLIAAAVIVVGVIAVAMGHGGEIILSARDTPEVQWHPRTPFDVATLRLPTGLFGYQQQATGDALREIAGLLAYRDAEIAQLRDELRQVGTPTVAGVPGGEPAQVRLDGSGYQPAFDQGTFDQGTAANPQLAAPDVADAEASDEDNADIMSGSPGTSPGSAWPQQ